MHTIKTYIGLLAAMALAVIFISCGTSDNISGSAPSNNPGVMALDTIPDPVIPVADTVNRILIVDLSGIDAVVDGKLEDVILSYYTSGMELSFLTYHQNIRAWVLVNEADNSPFIGFAWDHKHSFSESGLVAVEYLDGDNIIRLKINDNYINFTQALADKIKVYAVVTE